MSFKSDHVVVPFAVFNERRERRTRIAAALREHNRSDVAEQSPLAVAVAVTVACGQAPSVATRGQAPSAATEECE
jgi:hypothetical protein